MSDEVMRSALMKGWTRSPMCPFQSSGFSIKLSLQQYVQGTLVRSSTAGPDRALSGSRPNVAERKALITSPKPCQVLKKCKLRETSGSGAAHSISAMAKEM